MAAGAAALLVLAGWLATGFGAWARRSPQQTPLGWLVETLLEPGHWQLWLLQWPLPLVAAVGCIDLASRRSPALRAKGASAQTDRAKATRRAERLCHVRPVSHDVASSPRYLTDRAM